MEWDFASKFKVSVNQLKKKQETGNKVSCI